MSDQESDDEPGGPNWELLSAELGADALAALQAHLTDGAPPAPRDTSTGSLGAGAALGDSVPASNAIYKEREYWDARFETEEAYDWLVEADEGGESALLDALTALIAADDRVLVLGCGNSSLSAALHARGRARLVSTDFSRVVVRKMRARHPHMTWLVADMRDLASAPGGDGGDGDDEAAAARAALGAPHGTGSFDVVLDKAAMDALLVDEGSVWDPCDEARAAARETCEEVSRVLRPGGRYVQLSLAQPHFRRRYLLGEDYADDARPPNPPPESDAAGAAEPCGGAAPPVAPPPMRGVRDVAGSVGGFSRSYGWRLQPARAFGEEGCVSAFLYVAEKHPGS